MKLRNWMFVHKIKGKDMAEDLGISESHLSNVQHGKVNPSLSLMLEILKYTDEEVNLEDYQHD